MKSGMKRLLAGLSGAVFAAVCAIPAFADAIWLPGIIGNALLSVRGLFILLILVIIAILTAIIVKKKTGHVFPKKRGRVICVIIIVLCAVILAGFMIPAAQRRALSHTGVTTEDPDAADAYDEMYGILYNGPVLPLTSVDSLPEGVTVSRDMTLDFGLAKGGNLLLTDRYKLKNTTSEDISFPAAYPYIANYDMETPELTLNKESLTPTEIYALDTDLWRKSGFASKEFRTAPYKNYHWYRLLLADGNFQEKSFSDYTELLQDKTVTVYRLDCSNLKEDFRTELPLWLTVSFTFPEETKGVFTCKADSYCTDLNLEQRTCTCSLRIDSDEPAPQMLLFDGPLPKDITCTYTPEINGDSEETPKTYTLDDLGITASAEENANVKDLLPELYQTLRRTISRSYGQLDTENKKLLKARLPQVLYLTMQQAETAPKGQELFGEALEYIAFEDDDNDIRYLTYDIVIPAGQTVELTAHLYKSGNYENYTTKKYSGIYGYDFAASLGSTLTFATETATLEDQGRIEIINQNFGFDIEGGIKTVTLDPEVDHYWLTVRALSANK